MMPTQDICVQNLDASVVAREAHIRGSAGGQVADRRVIVLHEPLQPGRAIERHTEHRLSPRLSIAIIAGVSTALWLAIAAVVF